MVIENSGFANKVSFVNMTSGSIHARAVEEKQLQTGYDKQSCAVVMDISTEGYAKCKEMEEQQEKQEYSGESCNDCKTVQNLIDTVKNGGTLSEEEEKRLYAELQREVKIQYQEAKDLRLADDDERVLQALKDDYRMKQRTLADMKEQMQKIAEEAQVQSAETTKDTQEIAEKKNEVEMMNESLEEETASEKKTSKKACEQEDDTESSAEQEEVQGQQHTLREAFASMQKQEESREGFDEHKTEAAKKERAYSNMLENEYHKTLDSLEEEELSLKDKVEDYEDFSKNAKELAVNREIEKHRKIFQYEAYMDAKLLALSGQEMQGAQSILKQQSETRNDMLMQGMGQDFIGKQLYTYRM